MAALLLRARALHLALLRVSVVLVTLVSPEPELARGVAKAPSALRFFPDGLRLAASWLPASPSSVEVSRAVFYSAGGLALVGLFTRPALLAFGLAALHLFALCQLTGEVVHDMHLVWLLALLAASPAGDALSVDAALARRRPSRRRDPAYELALLFARALLGVVYFFPGFWKLATSGLAWITSDNVRNQMYWKWAQWGGTPPPVRVDLVPGLVEVGAACVVAFELGFFFFAFAPRARRPLAFGGLVFHQLTEVFFHIRFASLYACYTCLVADGGRRGVRGRWLTCRSAPVVAVGAVLLSAATVQGARGATQSYPFACYPTFAHTLGPEMPDVRLVALSASGEVRGEVLLPRVARSQSDWGMAWQIAGLWGTPASPDAVAAFARRDLAALSEDPAVRALRESGRLHAVRAHLAWQPVEPGRLGDPPRLGSALGFVPLAP